MTADAVGGVWTYAADLAARLVAGGWQVTIAVLGPAASADQRARAEATGVTLLDTGLMPEWLAADEREARAAADAVAGLAARCQPDVVQINNPFCAIAAFDAPVLSVVHSCVATWWDAARGGALPPDLAWRAELTGTGLAASDRVVAPSAAFGHAVAQRYALRNAPATVHNGRDLAAIVRRRREDFAFTAGRLWDAGKNVALLDAVAAQLDIPFEAAGATVAPHGEFVSLDALRPVGQLDAAALEARLGAQPIFVSAASYEPFGLAVLEAAHAGCALVLSDIPTFRELWGGVAQFVDQDDAAGFAAAIRALVRDPNARDAAGAAARLHARRYTATKMAEKMMMHYIALLEGNAVPGRAAA
ncbi:glycosyltransferase involved in cell wall biosynthesis [Sphingomonas zeicaulis]